MTRENYSTKGRRYLIEGRLMIRRVDGLEIAALCRGDGTVYRLGWSPDNGGWWCDCPARTDKCAHLHALRLVTIAGPEHGHGGGP